MSLNPYFGSLVSVFPDPAGPGNPANCTDCVEDSCSQGNGMLNPCSSINITLTVQQTKAFCRFLPVIIVLYLGEQESMRDHHEKNGSSITSGFLTTFTMLARDRLSLSEMSWILIKVFFG